MKCIKDKSSEKITRVKNHIASRRVDAGTHTFINKEEWKEKVRDKGKEKHAEVVET